jgi:hypothetical protein
MAEGRSAILHPDGRLQIRASAVGHCPVQLVAAALDLPATPPANWLQVKFTEGHIAEQVLLAFYRQVTGLVSIRPTEGEDWPMFAAPRPDGLAVDELDGEYQWAVELDLGGGIVVRGHIDDLCYNPDTGQLFVVEAKALGAMLWAELQTGGLQALPGYHWQLSSYLHGLGVDGVLIAGLKDEHGQWEIPVDEWAENFYVAHSGVDFQPVPIPAIRGKLQSVAAWIERKITGEAGPDEWPAGCDESPVCPFPQLHPSEQVQDWSTTDGEHVVEIRSAAEKHLKAGSLEYQAKKLKKEAREIVERVLGDSGEMGAGRPPRVDLGDVTVSYSKSWVDGATVTRAGYERTNITIRKKKVKKDD